MIFFVFKRYTQAVFVIPIANSRVPCTFQLQCCGWCETNSRNIFLTRRARRSGVPQIHRTRRARRPRRALRRRRGKVSVPQCTETIQDDARFFAAREDVPSTSSRGAICRRSISSSLRSTVFRQSSGSSKFSRRVIVGLDYGGLAKDFKESISTQRKHPLMFYRVSC